MKKIILTILTLTLALALAVPALALDTADTAAERLNELGLFKGKGLPDGGVDFALEDNMNRAEAVTMLVRLLGKEEEALAGTWTTPFTDVDDWAKPYVGYAYANGLTDGTGKTTFGGKDNVTSAQYLTFVLRALGYDSKTDFSWDKSAEFADDIGLTNGEYAKADGFVRGDAVILSSAALDQPVKTGDDTLLTILAEEGVIPPEESAAPPAAEKIGTKVYVPCKYTSGQYGRYTINTATLKSAFPGCVYLAESVLFDPLIKNSELETAYLDVAFDYKYFDFYQGLDIDPNPTVSLVEGTDRYAFLLDGDWNILAWIKGCPCENGRLVFETGVPFDCAAVRAWMKTTVDTAMADPFACKFTVSGVESTDASDAFSVDVSPRPDMNDIYNSTNYNSLAVSVNGAPAYGEAGIREIMLRNVKNSLIVPWNTDGENYYLSDNMKCFFRSEGSYDPDWDKIDLDATLIEMGYTPENIAGMEEYHKRTLTLDYLMAKPDTPMLANDYTLKVWLTADREFPILAVFYDGEGKILGYLELPTRADMK